MRLGLVSAIVGVGLLGASMVHAEPVNLIGAGGAIVGSVESLGKTSEGTPIIRYTNTSGERLYVTQTAIVSGSLQSYTQELFSSYVDVIRNAGLDVNVGEVVNFEVTAQFGGSLGYGTAAVEMYDIGVDLPDLRLSGGVDGPVYQALIGNNTGLIQDNDTDIAANTTAIEGNDTDIAANTTAIEGNDTDIAANTTAIEGNDTDIATNANGVSTNSGNIADLQAVTSTTSSGLAASNQAIQSNA